MVESYVAVWFLNAWMFQSFLEHDNFWYQIFSQGSVATYARCGGIFNNHFIANFQENPQWEKLKIGSDFRELLPWVWYGTWYSQKLRTVTLKSRDSVAFQQKSLKYMCASNVHTATMTEQVATAMTATTASLPLHIYLSYSIRSTVFVRWRQHAPQSNNGFLSPHESAPKGQ